MLSYNPYDWYWLADDGRLYTSARQQVVAQDDATYLAWCGPAGAPERGPTRWPHDDAGLQTDAALQDVLKPYGLWVDLRGYAADKRWRVETGGITVGGVTVATDDRSKTMIMGARIKADVDPGYVVGWKGADGGFVELSAPQIIAISDAVLAHVDACFAAEAAVSAAIADGAVTTTQQVDSWAWPADG